MSTETPLEEVKGKKPSTKAKAKAKPKPEPKPEPVKEVPIAETPVEEVELSLVDKLTQEKAELDKNCKKLFAFTRGPMEGVEPVHQLLLKDQYEAMVSYSLILGKRISLLK